MSDNTIKPDTYMGLSQQYIKDEISDEEFTKKFLENWRRHKMLTAVYDTGRSTDVMEIQKDAQYLKEEMTGCIYRHFKGGLYIVTDVVVNSESLKIEVIYKDFTPSQLTWSRDLKQFFSGVNTTKYPDALQRVRFKKVGRNGEIER